jgi:hypothetical protein
MARSKKFLRADKISEGPCIIRRSRPRNLKSIAVRDLVVRGRQRRSNGFSGESALWGWGQKRLALHTSAPEKLDVIAPSPLQEDRHCT